LSNGSALSLEPQENKDEQFSESRIYWKLKFPPCGAKTQEAPDNIDVRKKGRTVTMPGIVLRM
jgi:hypothetical protein